MRSSVILETIEETISKITHGVTCLWSYTLCLCVCVCVCVCVWGGEEGRASLLQFEKTIFDKNRGHQFSRIYYDWNYTTAVSIII